MSSTVRGGRWSRTGDSCQGYRAEKLTYPTHNRMFMLSVHD
jgi:hypothetical protein